MKFSHFNGKKPNSDGGVKHIGEPELIGYSKNNNPIYRIRYYIENADLKINTELVTPFNFRTSCLKYVESVVKVKGINAINLTSCSDYDDVSYDPINWFCMTGGQFATSVRIRANCNNVANHFSGVANYYITIVLEKRK